jgi:hypothetical protein
MKKIYTFRGQKGEIRPKSPKNKLCAPKSVLLCDEFINGEKKYTFAGQKGENKPSWHMDFRAQNQYGRLIYP